MSDAKKDKRWMLYQANAAAKINRGSGLGGPLTKIAPAKPVIPRSPTDLDEMEDFKLLLANEIYAIKACCDRENATKTYRLLSRLVNTYL